MRDVELIDEELQLQPLLIGVCIPFWSHFLEELSECV